MGIDYFLSKRTDVYIGVIWQHASGHDSTGHRAVADIYGLTASTSSNQATTAIGLRHAF